MRPMVLVLIALVASSASAQAQQRENIAGGSNAIVSAETLRTIPQASILRIEADIGREVRAWSGVRSCGRAQRARDALRTAQRRWVGRQIAARPGLQHLRNGWDRGRWQYSNRGRASGARFCNGRFIRLPVFIEFRRD